MNTGCWNSACASWLSAISTGGPLVLSWFLSSSGWCWAFRSWIYNSRRWQKEVTKRVCSKGGVYFTCRRWIWSERSFFSWHGLEREGVAAPGVFPAGIPSCDGCTIPPTCTWNSSSPPRSLQSRCRWINASACSRAPHGDGVDVWSSWTCRVYRY